MPRPSRHVLLLLVAVPGCLQYQRPSPRPARWGTPVAASFGRTWDAVINDFTDRRITIKTLDRASGAVATERLPLDADVVGLQVADCGTYGQRRLAPTHVAYTVLVRGDSTKATVTITPQFQYADASRGPARAECASRGVWEAQAEAAIKARAEGRPVVRAVSGSGGAPDPTDDPGPPPDAAKPGRLLERNASGRPQRDWYLPSEIEEPGRIVTAVLPQFPDISVGPVGSKQSIRVEYIVARDGAVDASTFRNLTPGVDARLVEAVRRAVLQWRYTQPWDRGQAVRMRVRQTFEFVNSTGPRPRR